MATTTEISIIGTKNSEIQSHSVSTYIQFEDKGLEFPAPIPAYQKNEFQNQLAENMTNKSIRRGFVRKVFGILAVQMAFTMGMIAFINMISETKEFFSNQKFFVAGVSILVATVSFLMLVTNRNCGRRFPLNFLLLGAFTFGFAIAMCVLSTYFRVEYVLYAGGMLFFTFLALTVYTFQTTIDVTWYMGLIVSIVAVGIISITLYFAVPSEEPRTLITSALFGLLLSVYATVFLHLMMSKNCFRISPEDYIQMAVAQYLIIMIIFIIALMAVAARGNNSCGNAGSGFIWMRFWFCPCFPRSRQNDEEDRE